jgi:hypothetical protein
MLILPKAAEKVARGVAIYPPMQMEPTLVLKLAISKQVAHMP